MFGVVISHVHFGRGLFSYSNFNFFYIDDKEETNLISRSNLAYCNFIKNFFYSLEVALHLPKKHLSCEKNSS